MKRLAPFFSYYGSKHRIAGRYPPPLHRHIVESFAGSAAYACRHWRHDVLVIDSNPKIAGLWDYLIRVQPSEVLALPLLEAGENVADLSGVPQEARWLIGFWLAKGQSTPAVSRSSWGRTEEYAGQFWGEHIRSRIARQVPLIKHWKVAHGSYGDAPEARATYFVDAPYWGDAGSHYPEGSDHVDYDHLGRWCRSRDGQVIVCEREGAPWLDFQPFARAKAMHGGKRTGVSHEVIWTKGCEPEQISLFAA